DRRELDGRRGSDVQHGAGARRDLSPWPDLPGTAGGSAARGPFTRGSPRPPASALRPACDPPATFRSGGRGLRVVVVGRAGARRLIALELRQVHVVGPGGRVGGQRDPERRTPADPFLHPRPTVVQLGEPRAEGGSEPR